MNDKLKNRQAIAKNECSVLGAQIFMIKNSSMICKVEIAGAEINILSRDLLISTLQNDINRWKSWADGRDDDDLNHLDEND